MSDWVLPLFHRFPRLAGRLPHHPFLAGPTPVEPFPLEAAPTGSLYVKRDERSTPVYGGNKPRKLEFLIGAADARGSRRLVTSGGLGTNHGLATALLAREAGMATSLLLVDQPVTDDVRRKLLLQAALDTRLLYGGSVPGAAWQGLRELVRSQLAGERPTVVPTGGTSARGDLGFVSAALELGEQVRAGALPEPRRIFVPVGTGGTCAGLVAGLALAGLRTRVVGVLVTDILPPSPRRLARLARASLELLRRAGAELPTCELGEIEWIVDQLGPGYGAPTPSAEDAVRAAADAGLRLETTYTGKALAALRRASARGQLAGPTLFWNTYNAVDISARALRTAMPADLPRPLQRFFGERTTR